MWFDCRSFAIGALGLIGFGLTAVLMGMVIFSHYKLCDPVSNGVIMSADQVGSYSKSKQAGYHRFHW